MRARAFLIDDSTVGWPRSALSAPAQADEKPVLTVYTYNSFTSEWGPGPVLEKAFEANAAATCPGWRSRTVPPCWRALKLEGKNTKADVVLGLDTNLTAEAKATGLIAPHGVDASRPEAADRLG